MLPRVPVNVRDHPAINIDRCWSEKHASRCWPFAREFRGCCLSLGSIQLRRVRPANAHANSHHQRITVDDAFDGSFDLLPGHSNSSSQTEQGSFHVSATAAFGMAMLTSHLSSRTRFFGSGM
jgi:hypothetical protein